MTSHDTSTLDSLRSAIERVTGKDCSAIGAEEDLNLDSINRISLIVEMENLFEIELGDDSVVPEIFQNLASLAAFVTKTRDGQPNV